VTREIELRLPLRDDSDIAAACRQVRDLAETRCMPAPARSELATAVSEIARNVIEHAGGGNLLAGIITDGQRAGVFVVVQDEGPGIASVEDAVRDGSSTGPGLGLGLSSARRLVDSCEIHSVAAQGTTVTLTKWIASDL
jgi:serine/threonine-protein kinase RsbT